MLNRTDQLLVIANARMAPSVLPQGLSQASQEILKADVALRLPGIKQQDLRIASGFFSLGQLVQDGFSVWHQMVEQLISKGMTDIRPRVDTYRGGFFALPVIIVPWTSPGLSEHANFDRLAPDERINGLPLSERLRQTLENELCTRIDRLGLLDVRRFLAVPSLFSEHASIGRELIYHVFARLDYNARTQHGLEVRYQPASRSIVDLIFPAQKLLPPGGEPVNLGAHSDLVEMHKLLTQIYRVPTRVRQAWQSEAGPGERGALTLPRKHSLISQRALFDISVSSSRWLAVLRANASLDPGIIDIGVKAPDGSVQVRERNYLLTQAQAKQVLEQAMQDAQSCGAVLQCIEAEEFEA